jgi:hypothetical protein
VAEPNHQLQRARTRIASPTAPGEPLSRRELAELVNAWLYEHTGRVGVVDDHYIGKLERGVVRWPQVDYRAAMRTVLRVREDHELGFRRHCGRRRPAGDGDVLPSAPLVPPRSADLGRAAVAPAPEEELTSPLRQVGQPANDLLLLDEWSAMHRRDVLGTAVTAGALAHLEQYLSALDTDPVGKVAAVRALVTTQRRREGSVPARDLVGAVAAHLRLLRDLGSTTADSTTRHEAAEALSEGFGFLAWLAWDMGEIGSAGRYYQAAVRLARESGHPTLTSYMLGSIAAFSAKTGNTRRGLLFADKARLSLPARRHPTVDAWLEATAAVTHAAAGDADQTWRCLDVAEQATARICPGEQPPWPWVMRFDDAKLAGYRLSAAVHLGHSDLALDVALNLNLNIDLGIDLGIDLDVAAVATAPPARLHTTQYALTLLDQAKAHSMKGDYDQSAAVALTALNAAASKHSHRVLRAAWEVRQAIPLGAASDAARHLDARLRDLDPVDL